MAESGPCPRCSPCHDDELLFSKKGEQRKNFGRRLHEFMDQWHQKLLSRWSLAIFKLFLGCLSLICVCLCSRDLAVIVASVAYNTWFTKLYCKDMRIVTTFSCFYLFLPDCFDDLLACIFSLSRSFSSVLILSVHFYLLISCLGK